MISPALRPTARPGRCRGPRAPKDSVRKPSLRALMLILWAAALFGVARASAQTGESTRQTPTDTLHAVRPGDVVRLRIWREPDLSGEFPVNEAGEIVFPKIGPVTVVRTSADSLKRLLISSYSAYLRDPSIEITLLRRVTILGAVRNPGVYPVDMTITISDAMALAGGAAEDGRADRVELRRGGKRLAVDLSSQIRLADTPLQSGDQIYFPQRSWLSRNAGLVVGSLTAVIGIAVTTMVR
jgi:protein involved in polysaccharide export with SLBB domain